MRGTPLGIVRTMVKAEAGKSLDTTDTALDPQINQVISNIQNGLAAQYDWPFLKSRWDLFLPPATRYTTFPITNNVGLVCSPDLERPALVEVKWNQIWQEIVYGIDEYPEFNYLDSDRNQILDPIQRWQFNDNGQFEVWPLPASQAQVRFICQRSITPLYSAVYASSGADNSSLGNGNWVQSINATGTYYSNGTGGYLHFLASANTWLINQSATVVTLASALYVATTILGTWALGPYGGVTTPPTFTNVSASSWNDSALLDLDDLLVAYYTAAEYLSRETGESAQAKFVLGKAQQRLQSLRGAYPVRTQVTTIGRGTPLDRKALRLVPMVLVAGNTK